jgi:hypothetical protein
MPVDPTIAPLLAAFSAAPATTDIDEIRHGMRQSAQIVASYPPIPMHEVEDRTVPGGAGEIPVRIYHPTSAPAPTVVFFHGGSWMAGDLETSICSPRRTRHPPAPPTCPHSHPPSSEQPNTTRCATKPPAMPPGSPNQASIPTQPCTAE